MGKIMREQMHQGVVVKSNRVIEASYRLSLNEQRIILAAIVEARLANKDLGHSYITIEAKKFSDAFGMEDGSVYGQLKEALDNLFLRFVTIRDIDAESGQERVSRVRWISEASYIDGAGAIQLCFSTRMIPYITRLESEFTSYRLEKVGKLTSAHAVRLYELLLQYQPIGVRDIALNWLKETLQIHDGYSGRTGIADFKKRVIDPSVDQINKHTDLVVGYENIKSGRIIVGLRFKIEEKKLSPVAQPKAAGKRSKITKAYIEKNARPGETYEQAYLRLSEKNS
jgi:plasmid replication initiation protein